MANTEAQVRAWADRCDDEGRTHTLTLRSHGQVTRPCNGWCRGEVHCWLVFSGSRAYTEEERADLRAYVERSGPYVEVIAVESAPEAVPWPDAPPAHRLGWAVLYRVLATDCPGDEEGQ